MMRFAYQLVKIPLGNVIIINPDGQHNTITI